MKGLMEQIRERGNVISFKPSDIKKEDIVKALEAEAKAYEESKRARHKKIVENEKHLKVRSKELGKEIPMELYYYTCVMPRPMGSWFFEKYEEWLN